MSNEYLMTRFPLSFVLVSLALCIFCLYKGEYLAAAAFLAMMNWFRYG